MNNQFTHLAGLTINQFRLWDDLPGSAEDTYKPKELCDYLKRCLSLPVKQCPEWVENTNKILKYYENIS